MGQALITRRGVPMLAPDVDDGYEQLINYTMLYDSGDECEEVTGGIVVTVFPSSFGSNDKGTTTKNSDHVYITGIRGGIVTSNPINLAEYSRAFVHWHLPSFNNNSDSNRNANFSLTNSTTFEDWYDSTNYRKMYQTVVRERGIDCLDISALNVSKHLQVASFYGNVYVYGMFLTKPDDIGALCYKAGVGTPSSLESLLADTTSLATIFNNEDAVKFMVAQCTGDFMVSVIANSTALGLLKASPYYTTVQANEHWVKFLAMVA